MRQGWINGTVKLFCMHVCMHRCISMHCAHTRTHTNTSSHTMHVFFNGKGTKKKQALFFSLFLSLFYSPYSSCSFFPYFSCPLSLSHTHMHTYIYTYAMYIPYRYNLLKSKVFQKMTSELTDC